MGGLVIGYTVYGGTKAVSYTQVLQMAVIFAGMFVAGVMIVKLMPPSVGFTETLQIAGKMSKTKVLDFNFDWRNQYNVWSGLIGGFFLQLSYFGTDQSQVGRYLTGKNIGESKLGLLLNGIVKIPMQFLILMLGAMVFAFYQYNPAPIFFNRVELEKVRSSAVADDFKHIEQEYAGVFKQKQAQVLSLVDALKTENPQAIEASQQAMLSTQQHADSLRTQAIELIKKNDAKADVNDTNYIFLNFVIRYLPKGLVGLLMAIIFLAAMGSLRICTKILGLPPNTSVILPVFTISGSTLKRAKSYASSGLCWIDCCVNLRMDRT